MKLQFDKLYFMRYSGWYIDFCSENYSSHLLRVAPSQVLSGFPVENWRIILWYHFILERVLLDWSPHRTEKPWATDLSGHCNTLNESSQGKDGLVLQMWHKLTARTKCFNIPSLFDLPENVFLLQYILLQATHVSNVVLYHAAVPSVCLLGSGSQHASGELYSRESKMTCNGQKARTKSTPSDEALLKYVDNVCGHYWHEQG